MRRGTAFVFLVQDCVDSCGIRTVLAVSEGELNIVGGGCDSAGACDCFCFGNNREILNDLAFGSDCEKGS